MNIQIIQNIYLLWTSNPAAYGFLGKDGFPKYKQVYSGR